MLKSSIPKEKVLAYITRPGIGGSELLVFEHEGIPEAGIQVPAGTVDPEEDIANALIREVREESGLKFSDAGNNLGRFPWFREDRNELHFRNVFHLNAPAGLPESWVHVVCGEGDDAGMPFRYFWLPVSLARETLAAEQGQYSGGL